MGLFRGLARGDQRRPDVAGPGGRFHAKARRTRRGKNGGRLGRVRAEPQGTQGTRKGEGVGRWDDEGRRPNFAAPSVLRGGALGEEIDGVAAGGGAAAEHATEFIDAVGFVEELDAGFGTAVVDVLADEVMGVGVGGDGGEVGDAEELMIAGDVPHFLSDDVGGFAADVGIDFIEDEHRDFILGGEDGLEGEHDAG